MLNFKKRNDDNKNSENLPYSRVLSKLLCSRGIDTEQKAERFLHPSFEQLNDPFLFADMEKFIKIIKEIKKNNEPVIVFGDYDCDGICASIILAEALTEYGINAQNYIPPRNDGYGLNIAAINDLSKKYKVLITVDLGISNHEEIIRAKELGMTVIVTDHHQLTNIKCPADAIIHPLIEPYPYKLLCGTGVAYKIACALHGVENCDKWLELAAIATIGDVVPLSGENRVIVALGLQKIKSTERIGLISLMNDCGINYKDEEVTTSKIAFQLVPRINATGRLESALTALDLLISKNKSDADRIMAKVSELNTTRKSIEETMLNEALEQVKKHDFIQNHVIFVKGKNWNPGIVGLVAGKLCEKYYCPVVALSINKDKATASVRSIPGINIFEMLQKCDEYLLKYGGHKQAAGLSIETKNIEAFFKALNETIIRNTSFDVFVPVKEYDIKIDLEDADFTLIDELKCFAPTGFGNPAPVFLSNNVYVDAARVVGNTGTHLKLALHKNNTVRDAIAFGMGYMEKNLSNSIDTIFAIKENTFRNKTSISLDIKAIKSAEESNIKIIDGLSSEVYDYSILNDIKKSVLKTGKFTKYDDFDYENFESIVFNQVQGDLLIAHTPQTAKKALEYFKGNLDICTRCPQDIRCFNTLLLNPEYNSISDNYCRIVLLDGALCTEQIEVIKEQFKSTEVFVLKQTDYLTNKINSLNMTDEEFRAIYKTILVNNPDTLENLCKISNYTKLQLIFALTVFDSLGFLKFSKYPFNISINKNAVKNELNNSNILAPIRYSFI